MSPDNGQFTAGQQLTFTGSTGRSGKRAVRLWCFLAAVAVYLYIASVARAHHPLGVFA